MNYIVRVQNYCNAIITPHHAIIAPTITVDHPTDKPRVDGLSIPLLLYQRQHTLSHLGNNHMCMSYLYALYTLRS